MESRFSKVGFETLVEPALRTINVPGVYAFHLHALRPKTVELDPTQSNSQADLKKAQSNCLRILERVTSFTTQQKRLKVEVRETGYPSLPIGVTLEGCMEPTNSLQELVEKLDIEDFEKFICAVFSIPTILPPVYVGVAIGQSVGARYNQHKSDFLNNTPKTFGGRFAKSDFDWGDLVFSYLPNSSTSTSSGHSLRVLEKYIHFFSRPILGER